MPDSSVAYFREYLRTIWMGLYNRGGGTRGSSGLEHVFGGEIASGGVSGFHSWIKYQKEEVKGSMNYLGYITNVELGTVHAAPSNGRIYNYFIYLFKI